MINRDAAHRGLYVHIPFCLKKCHYCDFVITTGNDHRPFLNSLKNEIAHYAPRFQKTVFETLYLGGGTPSVLTGGELKEIFGWLRGSFNFKKNAEITVETNPGDVASGKAEAYLKLGVNRISLGAQSFNDRTLKAVNRTHQAADTGASFKILCRAGFSNINADLILSLPGEGFRELESSLSRAVKLGPTHVSLYELTIEEKNRVRDRIQERCVETSR